MLNLIAFDANTARFKIAFCKRRKGSTNDFDEMQIIFDKTGSPAFNSDRAVKKSFSFNTGAFDEGYLLFNYQGNPNGWSGLFMTELDFYEGSADRLWQPSPDDSNEPIEAVRTQVTQLNNSYSIRNFNSARDVLGQLNLNPDGSIRINEGLLSIGEKTYIKDGVIKKSMIGKAQIETAHIKEIDASKANIFNLNVNNIAGLNAEFIKAKIEYALVDLMKGKVISAKNDAMQIDLNKGQYNVMTDQAAIRRILNGYPNQFLKFTSEYEGGAPASVTVLGSNRDGTENSKNDSFAGIRLYSGNKVERTEIISDVVRFATGAVNYRGWEMRTLYGNDNRQVILQPFGNVTRSNIVADYFNGIDLIDVLETLNQMMANLGNHTGRHDIFGPIKGLGARKYAK